MRWVNGKEFAEWIAYYSLEPFGQEAENWRTAQILAMLWNINSKKKKSPEDFMPKGPEADLPPDQNVLKKKLDVLMAAWGGSVGNDRKKPAKARPRREKPVPVQPPAPPTRASPRPRRVKT